MAAVAMAARPILRGVAPASDGGGLLAKRCDYEPGVKRMDRAASKDIQPRPGARHIEVDVRAFGAGQVSKLIGQGHDLLGWAVKFGAVLCERDHYWSRLVHEWRDRLPLPSAERARERAARAARLLEELIAIGDVEAAEEQAVALLTHLARARLLENGVYPASRPELPRQLEKIGQTDLARQLARSLAREIPPAEALEGTMLAAHSRPV